MRATVVSILPFRFQLGIFSPGLSKELRAVFPITILGMATIALSCLMWEQLRLLFTILACGVSCTAIGAMAAGHDFHYRTLTIMMALPIDRADVWKRRMGVAFVAMMPVLLLTAIVLLAPLTAHVDINSEAFRKILFNYGIILLSIPWLSGLFLAPWLTLVSRNVLFGTVFALAIPYLLMMVTELCFSWPGQVDANVVTQQVMFIALPVCWIAGATLGYRKFMSLEALDAVEPSTTRSNSRAQVRAGRRQNPYLALVLKELRLQQLPLIVAFVAALVTFAWSRDIMPIWTLLYALFTAVLIGAVASAEERQAGTAEWQLLAPIGFWKQWGLKTTVTLSLGLVFAAIVPISLMLSLGLRRDIGPWDFADLMTILCGVTILVTTVSLYISSLCGSALKAALVSFPFGLAVMIGVIRLFGFYIQSLEYVRGGAFDPTLENDFQLWPCILFAVGFIALLLWFGGNNHRFVERGPGRVIRQFLCLAGYFVAGNILIYWGVAIYLK